MLNAVICIKRSIFASNLLVNTIVMIRLNNVSYHLPQGFLYKEISMFIDKGHKIGLTGKNGVGKSTLLRLISGEITPSSGEIVKNKGLAVGYLPQDIKIRKDISIREYIEKSNLEVSSLFEKLELKSRVGLAVYALKNRYFQ